MIALEGFQVKTSEVEAVFRVSEGFLAKARYRNELIRGVHYLCLGVGKGKGVLYNRPLVIDWLVNRHQPTIHQRAIDNFLASLPSNQPAKRGPKN
jgi:hypothetical protein